MGQQTLGEFMTTPLIEFRNVTKCFGDKCILRKANLCIYPQEVTTLIGKSGVGKSVTLKLIIGLLQPDEGEILYQGQSLQALSSKERKAIRKQVNFMFQNNALFDSLHVYDNIALPLKEKTDMTADEIRQRVESKMDALDLHDIESQYPSQISGGMQKRVALARALITDHKVVLFDEPTTGLDPVRKNNVLSMITHNQKNFGFTAVLVSHDVPDVFYISNRIAVLEEAQIVFQGTPLELEQSDLQVVYEYINSVQSLENEIIDLKSRLDLEAAYTNMAKKHKDLTLFVFHIDNLERIRGRIGELMAHKIVSSVAGLVGSVLEGKDAVCGRYSQERIVCLVPGHISQQAEEVIRNVQQPLQETRFFHPTFLGSRCTPFGVTAGWTAAGPDSTLHEMVEQAEEAEHELARLVCDQNSGHGETV
jgi:phospholipid/cholesterol/gamma-HCH transport system ATP-binding protein